jgi:RND family efflux transporter MFP subunit
MSPDIDVTAPGPQSQPETPAKPPKRWRPRAGSGWPVVTVVIILAACFVLWRLFATKAGAHTVQAQPASLPTIAVAKALREDLYNEVHLPAEFRPYLQVELHAKVSGYVDHINVDIGDRVKAGQLLATLEVPELQAELSRSIAAEKRAAADYKDAHLVYTRLQAVEKDHPNLVAQQELDAAEAKDSTTDAAIAAAKADREKYQTMIGYTKITAPFDGVITHRYADPGSLIQAGTASDTQAMPLVRLSDNYHLRLDFPVSVAYVKDIHIGDQVDVRVESLGGKTFSGVISRSAEKIDEATRTMITEIEVANPNLELVPGMYAEALLKVQLHPHTLAVPIEAVSQEKPPTVYVVNQAGQIEVRPVKLGLETPSRYEVIAGLKEGDLVMIGTRSAVKPGQKVETKLIGPLAQQ